MHRIFKWHDRLTIAGNFFAVALLFVISIVFCYEVAARYLFNAPTTWVGAAAAYALCAAIFLAAPDLTRRNEHVTITLLLEAMPAGVRAHFNFVLRLIAGSMCVFAAWFCGVETLAQYSNEIETILEWQIPKWIVSVFIPYGFLNAALYFFRHLVEPAAAHGQGAAV